MILGYDECPVCKSKNIESEYREYYVPHSGKILIYHFLCLDCYYRTSEIIPLEENKEIRLELEIKDESDLKKKILRSEYADIYLKEIDLEIYSVNGSGLIMTIEGLIDNIINQLEEFKVISENKEEIDKKIQYLKEVLNNNKKLTIIIEDKKGLTKIIDY